MWSSKYKGQEYVIPFYPVGVVLKNQELVFSQKMEGSIFIIKKRASLYILENTFLDKSLRINDEKVSSISLEDGYRISLGGLELVFFSHLNDYKGFFSNHRTQKFLLNKPAKESKSLEKKIMFHEKKFHNKEKNSKTLELLKNQIFWAYGESKDFNFLCGIFFDFLGKLIKEDLALQSLVCINKQTKNYQLIINRSIIQSYVLDPEPLYLSFKKDQVVSYVDKLVSKGRVRLVYIFPFIAGAEESFFLVLSKVSHLSSFSSEQLEVMDDFLTYNSRMLEASYNRNVYKRDSQGFMEVLVAILEARDKYTMGHSLRVARYCKKIGEKLGLDTSTKDYLVQAAFLHDIGKIAISDKILLKKRPLSEAEYKIMQAHAELGSQMVSSLPGATKIMSGIKHHHERFDGSGYPDALRGETIPFFSRIIAVADSFDALVSGRLYQKAISHQEAEKKMRDESHLYDKKILEVFFLAKLFKS